MAGLDSLGWPIPKVLVAYPSAFAERDCRRVYREVGKAYGVEFVLARRRRLGGGRRLARLTDLALHDASGSSTTRCARSCSTCLTPATAAAAPPERDELSKRIAAGLIA